MRCLLLTSAVLLASLVTVASAETPAVNGVAIGSPATHIKRTVYLDTVVLEELQRSNPERYAQVRQIMATASELCAPNAARQWEAAHTHAAGGCSSMFLKTSYPPKREISFQIDDTMYIALVTVRDAPALLTPAPGKIVPADPATRAGAQSR